LAVVLCLAVLAIEKASHDVELLDNHTGPSAAETGDALLVQFRDRVGALRWRQAIQDCLYRIAFCGLCFGHDPFMPLVRWNASEI
jgi:hypothetical protein